MRSKTIFLIAIAATISGLTWWQEKSRLLIWEQFPEPFFADQSPTESMPPITLLCDQKFSFLGQGSQMIAYMGEDGETVLKIFKEPRLLSLGLWIEKNAPQIYSHNICRYFRILKTTQKRIFESVALAEERCANRTAMIYYHHAPSLANGNSAIHLTKENGKTFVFNLHSAPFVLQKYAELSLTRWKKIQANHDIEQAHRCLDSLLAMMEERAAQKIFDKDIGYDRNIGFIGDYAIEIDLGSYRHEGAMALDFMQKNAIYMSACALRCSLAQIYPELIPSLEQLIVKRLGLDYFYEPNVMVSPENLRKIHLDKDYAISPAKNSTKL